MMVVLGCCMAVQAGELGGDAAGLLKNEIAKASSAASIQEDESSGGMVGTFQLRCGGPNQIECDEGYFCKNKKGVCDEEDPFGRCTTPPAICPLIYAPVCGCDGITYGNACQADQAEVSINHDGECFEIIELCSFDGDCSEPGDFCLFPDGTCGLVSFGTCTPQPDQCILIYDPVCGCDGVTYGNACLAHQAGQSVASEGVCTQGQVCGGILGIPCGEGTYCQHPTGTCNIADNTGICEMIPAICPLFFSPVCGCDGETYGNACLAAQAEVSIDHPGICDE